MCNTFSNRRRQLLMNYSSSSAIGQYGKMPDLKQQIPEVFAVLHSTMCCECSQVMEKDTLATRTGREMKCFSCSNLEGLTFLPSGDVAVTRAAQKLSKRKAVVLRFNRSKKRFERQGILVSAEAIEAARLQCESDAPQRAKKRASSGERRLKQERTYVEQFSKRVREMYPSAPIGTELLIAEHACELGSGRVGRSSGAKQLSEGFVGLAVIAYVRHKHTIYDRILAEGCPRDLARDKIRDEVEKVLSKWAKRPKTG